MAALGWLEDRAVPAIGGCCSTPSSRHVSHILCVRTIPYMAASGSDAGRRVTVMEKVSVRGGDQCGVRPAVREDGTAVDAESSVAFCIGGALPDPALGREADLIPEALRASLHRPTATRLRAWVSVSANVAHRLSAHVTEGAIGANRNRGGVATSTFAGLHAHECNMGFA